MYLHEDINNFCDLITNTSERLDIPPYFVEKDYYICVFLSQYMQEWDGIMFKGGTALSKGWKIVSRFSEDIDVNLRPDIVSTDSSRMKTCKTCKSVLERMGLSWEYPERIGSRKEYNCFRAPYLARCGHGAGMRVHLKIELVARKRNKVLNTTYSDSIVSSYIWQAYDGDARQQSLIGYHLQPFHIPVQNMDVTFVEKCLSLANKYIEDTPVRTSRHLYDIYCMWNYGNLQSFDLQTVIEGVKVCLKDSFVDVALRGDKSFKTYLVELLQNDYYCMDYMLYTDTMKMRKSDNISYWMCKKCLLDILSTLNDF